MLGTVLPHPTAIIASNISMAEVTGLIDEEHVAMQSVHRSDEIISAVPPHQGRDDPATRDGDALSVADLDLSHVLLKYRDRLGEMLSKYAKMWDGSLREITTTEHHLDFAPEARPVACPPYRAGPKAREIEQREVDRMLAAGVIEPAQSAWASPVVLVPEPDGSLCFCVEYRKLDSLGSATIYTKLDCNYGYWQLPVAKNDCDKTAFVCHAGLFRYKRMPFGLSNAPASF